LEAHIFQQVQELVLIDECIRVAARAPALHNHCLHVCSTSKRKFGDIIGSSPLKHVGVASPDDASELSCCSRTLRQTLNWMAEFAMEQTPAHDLHNPELLQLMPATARTVVEIGCSSGALAREYKKINGRCHYIGIDIMSQYIPLAKRYCDTVLQLDIEHADEAFLRTTLPGDCWVFGDTLEHLSDPWAVLSRIRSVISADGCVVACIPNAQPSTGAFRHA
jgi:2-polyprenyl-3-methyl-5-hydroxy-6-metoxy-1,4-benzoquinol methylase